MAEINNSLGNTLKEYQAAYMEYLVLYNNCQRHLQSSIFKVKSNTDKIKNNVPEF